MVQTTTRKAGHTTTEERHMLPETVASHTEVTAASCTVGPVTIHMEDIIKAPCTANHMEHPTVCCTYPCCVTETYRQVLFFFPITVILVNHHQYTCISGSAVEGSPVDWEVLGSIFARVLDASLLSAQHNMPYFSLPSNLI